MSNCTSSCKTKDHANYGECIRSNTPMFVGVNPTKTGWDQDKVKRDEKEIQSYWAATKQGIEPRSTRKKDIDAAVKLSNEAGKAFDGISTLCLKLTRSNYAQNELRRDTYEKYRSIQHLSCSMRTL
jgi:hypothetical protein